MRTLSTTQLRAVGACTEQVDRFRELFGDSVEVTPELAAAHPEFDYHFAAKLLSPKGRAEYERVEGPALAEYERVTGPAWAEYQRVTGPAWAEYQRVEGPAWARIYVAEGA